MPRPRSNATPARNATSLPAALAAPAPGKPPRNTTPPASSSYPRYATSSPCPSRPIARRARSGRWERRSPQQHRRRPGRRSGSATPAARRPPRSCRASLTRLALPRPPRQRRLTRHYPTTWQVSPVSRRGSSDRILATDHRWSRPYPPVISRLLPSSRRRRQMRTCHRAHGPGQVRGANSTRGSRSRRVTGGSSGGDRLSTRSPIRRMVWVM
jgi:hypothetical protein